MNSITNKAHSRFKKLKYIVPVLALVILAGATAYYLSTKKTAPSSASNSVTSTSINSKTPRSSSINMIATGDWIAHDSINSAAKQPDGSYNYMPMIKDFVPIFSAADIRFCNDPILNGGESLGIHGYPKFNSPTEFVTDMGKLGCNVVNLASNHSFDYTQANITNSVTAWKKTPGVLAFAGENQNQQQHDSVSVFDVKGVKTAFLAYTSYINSDAPVQNSYGVNVFSEPFVTQQLDQARKQGAKFIIVSMRWGTEYSQTVSAAQQQEAQWLADQGVNLVLGHGTHELQPVQWLTGKNGNKTLIWYGLGDFLQSQEPAATVFNGIAVMKIDPKTYAITSLGFLPIYMHYEWTPAQKAADDIAARTNLHLYLLEDANQNMINAQQLNTTIQEQEQRMQSTLATYGVSVPLLTSRQYYQEFSN